MTPSQTIIQRAAAPLTATVSDGRRLVIRQLTALDTLRLLKAAGPTLAQNEAWLAMAALVFAVLEIDGVPVPTPVTEQQIEGLVERLGDSGLDAISEALQGSPQSRISEPDLGNLPGTPS